MALRITTEALGIRQIACVFLDMNTGCRTGLAWTIASSTAGSRRILAWLRALNAIAQQEVSGYRDYDLAYGM